MSDGSGSKAVHLKCRKTMDAFSSEENPLDLYVRLLELAIRRGTEIKRKTEIPESLIGTGAILSDAGLATAQEVLCSSLC